MLTPFASAPVTLRGTHVRLEPLSQEHVPGILAACNFPEIWTYLPSLPVTTLDGAEAWVAEALAERDAGRQVPFVLVDQVSSAVIGSTRFLDLQRTHRGLEIGSTWITPSAQRTAANTEQKLLLLQHAFESLGAIRVALKTDSLNLRSQAAIARIGATREGTLRSHMILPSGRVRDTVYFSVLREEWPAVKERLVTRLAAG